MEVDSFPHFMALKKNLVLRNGNKIKITEIRDEFSLKNYAIGDDIIELTIQESNTEGCAKLFVYYNEYSGLKLVNQGMNELIIYAKNTIPIKLDGLPFYREKLFANII